MLNTSWKDLFDEINDQINEFEEKEKYIDVDTILSEEQKRKELTKKVISEQSKLAFTIEGKTLKILFANLSLITIKFYLINMEILFSIRPFFKQVFTLSNKGFC